MVVYEYGTSKDIIAIKWGCGAETYSDTIDFLVRKGSLLTLHIHECTQEKSFENKPSWLPAGQETLPESTSSGL